MGWYFYKDENGNRFRLADCLKDGSDNELDESKLPQEAANAERIRFVWDTWKRDYFLKFFR